MSWNYRIVRSFGGSLGIHEVYYDATGNPRTWTENPIVPYGETLDELRKDFEMMSEALSRPILIEVVEGDHVKLECINSHV